MRCPFCFHKESKVLDSRATEEGTSIRRRRECTECRRRFTTYERLDEVPFMVVKKDGRRKLSTATKSSTEYCGHAKSGRSHLMPSKR